METKIQIELQLSDPQTSKNEAIQANKINAKTIQQFNYNDALSGDITSCTEITMGRALQSPRPEDFTHYLSAYNTILHKYTNQQTGNMILNAIYNTKWVTFIALCSFVFLVYDVAFPSWPSAAPSGESWFIMYRAILFPIVNLWLISVCFTVNRRAFALIIQSFEFWLKVGECLLFVTCDFFIQFYLRTWKRSILEAWVYLQFLAMFLFAIITFSLFDAIRMSMRKKFAVGVVAALITTFQAWLASSFAWNDDMIELGPYSFKLSGFMSGAMRTLAIFVWKQTVFSYVSRHKFLTVGYKPYLVWIDEHDLTMEDTRPFIHWVCDKINAMSLQVHLDEFCALNTRMDASTAPKIIVKVV